MDKRKVVERVRRVRDQVLEEIGEYVLPIDVNRACREYGVGIEEHDLPLSLTGALIYDAHMPYILVNARLDPGVKTLCIAHELSHYILGHRPKRLRRGWKPSPEQEAEAEVLAWELLFPAQEWTREIIRCPHWISRLGTESRAVDAMSWLTIRRSLPVTTDVDMSRAIALCSTPECSVSSIVASAMGIVQPVLIDSGLMDILQAIAPILN